VERKGLRQATDAGQLEQWCAEAIAANPKSVADFRAGRENAINAMKGFVMKQSKGRANPRLVDEILRRRLAGG
jgi:aspartyl-tRNA(Asn)/glutamyl-tRNA(Gln) amidotransferase subunit B